LALTGGEIQSGQYHTVLYDGTNFQLQNPAAFFAGSFGTPIKAGVQSGTSTPWSGMLMERLAGLYSGTFSGLWPSSGTANIASLTAQTELAGSATDPTGAPASNPRFNMFLASKTTDSALQSVGLGVVNLGYNTTSDVEGINIIVGNNISSTTTGRVTGVEVDLQGIGSASFIGGYEVQVFTGITADCGFRLTGNGTGKFKNGIDLSGGTYTNSALKIGNAQLILLYDTGGSNPAEIYMDASNVLQIISTVTGTNAAGFSLGGASSDYNMLRLNNDLYLNRPSGHPIHFREANGSDQMAVVSGTPTLGNTSLQLMAGINAGTSLQNVTLGATNSGGSGFRALVVPN
jgi:hypothetical protein